MMDWIFDHEVIVFCVILGVVIVGVGYAVYWDERNWQAYAAQHHCVAKGIKRGTIGTGVGTDSKGNATVVTTTTPDQTIYVCDEGEMVIR